MLLGAVTLTGSCVSDHGEYTECHRVIQSIRVTLSITEQNRTKSYKYRVSQSNTEYYRVTQRVTEKPRMQGVTE